MIMRIEFFVIAFLFFFSFVFSVSSQTTELFFSGFKKVDPSNLTLNGVAGIEHNGLLRLTNQTSRLLGHCFYSSPVRLKNPRDDAVFSFSTTFAFAIVPQFPTLGGHGLAFAVSPTVDLAGAVPTNYLGLFNSSSDGNSNNHLFAVEFDTVQDFGFQDINENHVGVDINSIVSKAASPAGYFGDNDHRWRNITLQSGRPIFAWIEYDSGPHLLNVTLSPNSTKPSSPILSFPVDLSPILRDEMYVGFSAATGLLASSHYIMGWSFKINGRARDLDFSSLPSLKNSKKKNQTGLIVGVSVSAVVIVLSAIAVSIFLFLRFKNADVIEDWEFEVGPHRFSYAELKKATRNFSDSELLGRGGFGRVYRGTLPGSKTHVAVKRVSHESKQGLREFVSEIASIGRLRHRNLVQLLGWCRRRGDLLLVYEFMPYGSLDKFLFDKKPQIDLNWDQRFKIIRDVASALLYLHEGYEQVVLHRDVKASNVLLDGELNGRLGDFGLARLYDHGSKPGTTRVVGTLGYLPPEVSRTGKFTTGSDVYAFGMFLLEVVCGRRPIEPKTETGDLVLVDLVWNRFKSEKVLDMVDPKIGNRYNESEVLLVIKLGLMCTDGVLKSRPSVRQAVRYLDRENDIPANFGKSGNRYDESKFNVDQFDGFGDFTGSTLFDRTKSQCWNSYTGTGSGRPDSTSASPVSPLNKTM